MNTDDFEMCLFLDMYEISLKNDIINENLKCRDDVAFKLASFAVQGIMHSFFLVRRMSHPLLNSLLLNAIQLFARVARAS